MTKHIVRGKLTSQFFSMEVLHPENILQQNPPQYHETEKIMTKTLTKIRQNLKLSSTD